MSDISKQFFSGAKLKMPMGVKMCLGDRGILENILESYAGFVKRETRDGIVINAPFESKSDYEVFLSLVSNEFLANSNLGINYYLNSSQISNPEFIRRKALVLDHYKNSQKVGDIFYENILDKFKKVGLRVIRTFVGLDYILGFEEIEQSLYLLERYNYIDAELILAPKKLDISQIEYQEL